MSQRKDVYLSFHSLEDLEPKIEVVTEFTPLSSVRDICSALLWQLLLLPCHSLAYRLIIQTSAFTPPCQSLL